MKIDKKSNSGIVWIKDFNAINDCAGVLYQIESYNDVCMLGEK